MAKYWVFQSNQVNGPHDPDDLAQLPGFSAETLVCPEGRKGTNMGDWQRASMVPELSVTLLKASNLAVALKGAAAGPSLYGNLPPEPTLKDLAALGSLQEKVTLLDATVGQLQESLRLKEQELLSVHRELDEKTKNNQELAVKLGGVEERLSTVGELRQGLDAAVAAEHEVAEIVQKQSSTIDELTRQLETLRAEKAALEESGKSQFDGIKSQIESLMSRPAPAAPAPAPSISPAPSFSPAAPLSPASGLGEPPATSPFAGLPTERPSDALGGGMPAASSPSPFGEPPAAGLGLSPAPSLGEPIAPVANLGDPIPFGGPPAPAGLEMPGFQPTASGSLQPPVPFNPVGEATSAPAPVAMDMTSGADLAAPPKKSSKSLVLVVLLLAAVGAGGAFKLGLIGKPKPQAMPVQPPPPMAETPRTPTPEEQAEALKQQAIDLVRGWPVGTSTLASLLETPSVQAGGLSPWQADRVKDSLFQVNFYSPKSSGGSGQTYEFEADLSIRRVTARNEAAVAAMGGSKKPTTLAAKRKPKIKAKKEKSDEGALLQDLLSVDAGGTGPAAQAPAKAEDAAPADDATASAQEAPKASKKARAPKKKPEESLDELLAGGKEPRKAKKKGEDDESLDQILLPGIPRRDPSLDEPVAEAAARVAKKPASRGSATSQPASGDELPDGADEPAPAPKAGKKGKRAADAELLDDLLKP